MKYCNTRSEGKFPMPYFDAWSKKGLIFQSIEVRQ